MASTGGRETGGAGPHQARGQEDVDPHVAEMLKNLHLTAQEGEHAVFSDDEEEDETMTEWALVGKVISPGSLHQSTIFGALKPAWGNPVGLRIRSIGEKKDNLFVAEFGCKMDMERILASSPWNFGKYTVILREYDDKLKPSQIRFERMEIWVRLVDLPLGWMNQQRGARAMKLLGDVVKMDVDKYGKASGPFLPARVAIDLGKPIKRGVLLKMTKDGALEWFDAQYEKLPFFCRSCGVIGHSDLVCETPAPRDEEGKLPYDLTLRVDDRKRKPQSFADAAAESLGSAASSGSKQSRESSMPQRADWKEVPAETMTKEREEEVTSPMNETSGRGKTGGSVQAGVNRPLFQTKKPNDLKLARKQKSKTGAASATPDLNLPISDLLVLVPAGTVSARVNLLAGLQEGVEGAKEELLKKQKMCPTNIDARSTAAASSPRRAQ
jgi:hypothetical protein